MYKDMKTQYIIPLIITAMLSSCSPDPSTDLLASYGFGFLESNEERLLAGETSGSTLNYYVYTDEYSRADSLMVVFEALIGGGSVTQEYDYILPGDTLEAQWQLGSDEVRQVLEASVYDMQGNHLSFARRTAYGFRENEWDGINIFPDGNMRDMVADTATGMTLMISNMLYRQGDSYFLWKQVNDQVFAAAGIPVTVEIDSDGVVYASTWRGEVLRSNDHGQSWTICTKPYPERYQYVYNYVANDNSLWSFVPGYTVKRSLDGGDTWNEMDGDMGDVGFGDVFRLDNGNLVYHGSDCCSLYMSDDDGQSWTNIPTPGYSVKLFVGDNDELIIVTQESGMSIYHSDDYGTTFTLVHRVMPQFGTIMHNTFTRYGDFYYVLIPGFGILKTYDLKEYENYWINTDLMDLFIDHNGVLIAKDHDYETVYYRNNTDRNFYFR